MAKRPPRKVIRRKVKPAHRPRKFGIPKAYASSTKNVPSTAGKFNPPGWTGTSDYGVQGGFSTQSVPSTPVTTGFGGTKKRWHKSQTGELGKAIEASKMAHPQAWMTATGPRGLEQPKKGQQYDGYLQSLGQSVQGKVQQVAQTTGTIAKRASHDTWYATSPDGKTTKGRGHLSLQARQYYAEQGVKVTSRPPGQKAQQKLSDTTGITTYTQWGDLSTTPRDLSAQKKTKLRIEQQRLSDQYGITTYNKDGTVSTTPKQKQEQAIAIDKPQQAAGILDGSWWWQSPFSASAEKDKKEKPWGWW